MKLRLGWMLRVLLLLLVTLCVLLFKHSPSAIKINKVLSASQQAALCSPF
jgi:hypothetical protein